MDLAKSYTIEDAKRKLDFLSITSKPSEQSNIKNLKKTMLEEFEKVNKNLETMLFEISVVKESINEKEIETNPNEKENAEKLLTEIISRLDKIQHPEKDKILGQLNGELSTSAKLKLTIPIIPGIVKYETDLKFTGKEVIKSWKDLLGVFVK